MNITLTDALGSNVYVIPVVVSKDVEMEFTGEHETYTTLKGPLKIPGKKALDKISWSGFFPVNKDYSFVAAGSLPNGWDYVDFIKANIEKPIRVVVTNDDKKTIMNMLATVDKFSPKEKDNKDIDYSIELSEFNGDIWEILNA